MLQCIFVPMIFSSHVKNEQVIYSLYIQNFEKTHEEHTVISKKSFTKQSIHTLIFPESKKIQRTNMTTYNHYPFVNQPGQLHKFPQWSLCPFPRGRGLSKSSPHRSIKPFPVSVSKASLGQNNVQSCAMFFMYGLACPLRQQFRGGKSLLLFVVLFLFEKSKTQEKTCAEKRMPLIYSWLEDPVTSMFVL